MDQNADAFEELFKRYKNHVVSFVIPMVGSRQSAEEICQEVFMKVYRKASTYNSEHSFKPWFWTLVRNTTYDQLRKKKELLYEDFKQDDEDNRTFDVEDVDENLEEKLITKMESLKLQKLIEKLPAGQKEVLLLQVFSELNYDEISAATGKSVSSVKSLLFRARKSLVDLMEKENE